MTDPIPDRKPGPFDSEFERGYVPMDAPPGIEEHEYARWKAAGGKVLATPTDQYPAGTLADLPPRAAIAGEIVANLARLLPYRSTPETQTAELRRNSLLALAQADDLLAVLAEQTSAPPRALASLWEAVNEYAAACGGHTGEAIVGPRRMNAVVAVERAVGLTLDVAGIRRALEIVRDRLAWLHNADDLILHEAHLRAVIDAADGVRHALSLLDAAGGPTP